MLALLVDEFDDTLNLVGRDIELRPAITQADRLVEHELMTDDIALAADVVDDDEFVRRKRDEHLALTIVIDVPRDVDTSDEFSSHS